MGLTIEWVDVVKRAGQTAHLASLLLLSTAIKWRRPDNDAPLATVTVPAVLLQLGATLCEYAPLFHPGTRTFRKALGVYEDAVGKISEEASLFDAVLAMMGTVAEQRVAQSCCVAILLCALSGACAYYALQLRLRGAARQRLLQLAVYGACGFALACLALAPGVAN